MSPDRQQVIQAKYLLWRHEHRKILLAEGDLQMLRVIVEAGKTGGTISPYWPDRLKRILSRA